MSTYLDLPLTASLVMLWLFHACLLDWTYNSDTKLGWDLKLFKNFDLFELPSFFPKVFLKLLLGARPFLLCLPISDKHTFDAMCRAMYDCA